MRPVPRSVWLDKPQLLGIRIRQEFWGDSLGGIPATVFGEFYVAFGYLGLLVGSIFLGWVLGMLERLYRLSIVQPDVAVLYGILTVTVVFTVVRSGLEIGIVNIAIYLLIIATMNVMMRLRIATSSGVEPDMQPLAGPS